VQVKVEPGPAPDAPRLAQNVWKESFESVPLGDPIERGLKWLAATQGDDGGWGQDGGAKKFARESVAMESEGNDVANTCVATLALLHCNHTPKKGAYSGTVLKGLEFVLKAVEEAPEAGLAIKTVQKSQVQRKLGQYIDTFLAGMLLAEIDGNMADADGNARVRKALNKVTAKIQNNQQKDGSWNFAGGWAPILGTTMASKGLRIAQAKGAAVRQASLDNVEKYTKESLAAEKPKGSAPAVYYRYEKLSADGGGSGGGSGGFASRSGASAGVKLYDKTQAYEELSKDTKSRVDNVVVLTELAKDLSSEDTLRGFGSMGGEEFFSYLNISDSLRRTGGEPWEKWNTKIKAQLLKLQNQDGTWCGHHCITGRVACTGAALLTLVAERTPVELVPVTK
jgi:hypothetical protein